MNGLLPFDAATRALATQVVPGRVVAEPGDEVIDCEVELEFGREVGVGARRQIGGARRERGDRLGTGLSEHSKLLPVRIFEVESPEERVESVAELFIRDGVANEMRATHFLGFIRAEPGEYKSRPAVARAAAHLEEVLRIFDERAGYLRLANPINTEQNRTSNRFPTGRNENQKERRRIQANFNEFLEAGRVVGEDACLETSARHLDIRESAVFRARLPASELVAADHDGDQAGDFGDRSGEEGLEVGESCVEGSAALCKRQSGKENEQGKEGGGLDAAAFLEDADFIVIINNIIIHLYYNYAVGQLLLH